MSWHRCLITACTVVVLVGCGHDGAVRPPTVDQDTALAYGGYAAGWADCWQSFTSGVSGRLTAVRVWALLPSGATLTLYRGEGTAGEVLATTTSLHDVGGDRWEAALPGLPVAAGSTYTVRLSAATDVDWVVGTDAYEGGVSNVYGAALDFGLTTYVLEAVR